jgi:hypothetical protein
LIQQQWEMGLTLASVVSTFVSGPKVPPPGASAPTLDQLGYYTDQPG